MRKENLHCQKGVKRYRNGRETVKGEDEGRGGGEEGGDVNKSIIWTTWLMMQSSEQLMGGCRRR